MVLQQFEGINAFAYYAGSLFESAGILKPIFQLILLYPKKLFLLNSSLIFCLIVRLFKQHWD